MESAMEENSAKVAVPRERSPELLRKVKEEPLEEIENELKQKRKVDSAYNLRPLDSQKTGSKTCNCCSKRFKNWRIMHEHELFFERKNKKPKKSLTLVCNDCEAGFPSKYQLLRHMKKSHTDQFKDKTSQACFDCKVCQKVFTNVDVLRSHLLAHVNKGTKPEDVETELTGFTCKECGKRISSKDHMKKHLLVHTGERPYTCLDCGQAFALRNTMRVHALSHYGIKPYACPMCKLNYSQRSALMIHWKAKHKNLPSPPPIEIHQYFDEEGKVLAPCELADRFIEERKKIEGRARRASSQRCAIRIKTALELLDPYDDIPEKKRKARPKKKVTNKEPDPFINVVDFIEETPVTVKEEPVDTVDEKLYRRVKGGFRCLICRVKFTHRYKVNYHIKFKHGPAKLYQCDKCPKNYRSKYLYNVHTVQHLENSSDFMYFCDKCDYRTRSKHYLKTHAIRKHTSEAKFECHHCGKRFKIKCDLKSHIDTHSATSYMCDICGGMYKSQDALNKHRRVKHLNEYKFRCDVCHQKLISRETFEAHMKNHQQPYGCDECELTFIKKSYLTRHKQRVHREQKTHACPVCERKFMCRSTMRVHYLTHGRIKPYQCTVCGLNFTQRSSMMLHWRRKHPEETEPPPPVILTNFFDSLKIQVNEHIENGGTTKRSKRLSKNQ